jgi:O-antigen/teichoic acid export membrane protein
MLIVLAKLGSPQTVGVFALGAAVSAPVVLFANLKLRSVQATDARREYSFPQYLALRVVTSLLALLVIAVVALAPAEYSATQRAVILLVGFAMVIESVSDVYFGLIQQHERMRGIAISMAAKGVLSLIAVAATVWITDSVVAGCGALVIAWSVVLVAYDIPLGRELLRDRDDPSSWRAAARALVNANSRARIWHLARTTFPLGTVVMLGSLHANIPRYFVEHHQGVRSLGIFAALSYLVVAGNMVINALGQSAGPRLAKHFAAGDRSSFLGVLRRLLCGAAVLGGVALACVALAGRFLLGALYRPEYGEHADVLLWLVVAASVGWAYVFIGTAVSAMRRFHVQLPIHLVSTAVLVIACWLLVPPCGLLGAAWAILACAVAEAAAYAFAGWKLYSSWNATPSGREGNAETHTAQVV